VSEFDVQFTLIYVFEKRDYFLDALITRVVKIIDSTIDTIDGLKIKHRILIELIKSDDFKSFFFKFFFRQLCFKR